MLISICRLFTYLSNSSFFLSRFSFAFNKDEAVTALFLSVSSKSFFKIAVSSCNNTSSAICDFSFCCNTFLSSILQLTESCKRVTIFSLSSKSALNAFFNKSASIFAESYLYTFWLSYCNLFCINKSSSLTSISDLLQSQLFLHVIIYKRYPHNSLELFILLMNQSTLPFLLIQKTSHASHPWRIQEVKLALLQLPMIFHLQELMQEVVQPL